MRSLIAGFVLAAAAAFPAAAQTPLFSDSTEVGIVLEAPFNSLVRGASRNVDPVPAVATVTAPEGQAERFEIEIAPRGFSRRTGGICNFPPLRLNFDATRGTFMQGQNRLKLVTRCRGGANYEQLTVLEYTAYRLYNEITPMSFRVRPVRVTYRDTEGRRREETQFNFLVEDLDDVARRNGEMAALDTLSGEVRSSQLDPNAAAAYGLFQYMIGNLDWDMVTGHAGDECCHNSKLVAVSAESRENVVPVPYDFDYSGFVNAPYAIPPESLNVANVRTRLYRGLCRHNEQAPAAAERIRGRRDAIYAVIDGETRLNDATRRSARRYIEEFFAVLDDPERFQRQIIQRCRS
ncbi:MAG: hypothetical protein H7124_02445 [Phycisphaerales bacterium]|nr:hypothetical protein [Hyphomonadaceae bacterium]